MGSSSTARPVLRRSLGQHHLTRGEVCRPLVDFLRPRGERVVEIGPGGGVLTRELLAAGATVLGLELDIAWAVRLRESLPGARPAPRIVVGDALELPWERLPTGTLVAGNLPYNVATPIIARVLLRPERVRRAGFLVQLEVAERLAAEVGDSAYGALSVLTRARARVEILGRVRPGAFHPRPRVDSAFVGLELHPPPLPEAEMEAFQRLVFAGFGRRRKTVRNALAAVYGRQTVETWLAAAAIDGGLRAEQLGLGSWLRLFETAGAHSPEC